MVEGKVEKRFEVKKWNAVALWAWGIFSNKLTHVYRYSC
jgi:hypothetical protein